MHTKVFDLAWAVGGNDIQSDDRASLSKESSHSPCNFVAMTERKGQVQTRSSVAPSSRRVQSFLPGFLLREPGMIRLDD